MYAGVVVVATLEVAVAVDTQEVAMVGVDTQEAAMEAAGAATLEVAAAAIPEVAVEAGVGVVGVPLKVPLLRDLGVAVVVWEEVDSEYNAPWIIII